MSRNSPKQFNRYLADQGREAPVSRVIDISGRRPRKSLAERVDAHLAALDAPPWRDTAKTTPPPARLLSTELNEQADALEEMIAKAQSSVALLRRTAASLRGDRS